MNIEQRRQVTEIYINYTGEQFQLRSTSIQLYRLVSDKERAK